MKIILDGVLSDIINYSEKLLHLKFHKNDEISIDDLFDLIDSLNAEIDRLNEEMEED